MNATDQAELETTRHVDLWHKLEAIEARLVKVEEGLSHRWQLPWQAWTILSSILLFVVAGMINTNNEFIKYGERQVYIREIAEKALSRIEEHMSGSGAYRATVESLAQQAGTTAATLAACQQAQERLAGQLEAMDKRLGAQERRSEERDRWWHQLWQGGTLRGGKP